jgi:hypothetical protein
LYQWIKRYENQWAWITLSVDTSNQNIHFYLNGKESDARHGHGTQSPLKYNDRLKSYGLDDYYLGTTTSTSKTEPNRWFKGDISKVMMWNRCLDSDEITNLHKETPTDKLVLHYDFNSKEQIDSTRVAIDLSGNGIDGKITRGTFNKEKIKIPHTIIPHRKDGKMNCLPHKDEGMVKDSNGNDVWAKGKTTARNEKRYIHEMQQGTWDYKSDGIEQLEYELLEIEEITPKAKLINVKL